MKNKKDSIILSIMLAWLIGLSGTCFAASNTSKILKAFSIMAVSVNKVALVAGGNFCPLCETHGELPKRLDFPLDCNSQYTCLNLYVDLSAFDETDPECSEKKAKYQQDCCGDEEPTQTCPPTEPPSYNGPVGNEPDCPICGTMEYPGIPNALIVARYVGEYTCGELYDRGLHGLTPYFMCGPLQDFAQEPCGCGEFNPRCIEDPTKCWGHNPPETEAPTPEETPSPTNPFKRKTRPPTSKHQNKLSGGRGGAGGKYFRGGHRKMTKGTSESINKNPTEIN